MNKTDTGGKRSKGCPPRDGEGPLVSIVTVVYNGAATLERTIESVVTSSYRHLEYIVIDDGSSDGTVDLLKKHDKSIDFWKVTENKGIYESMNLGISLCSGEWIGLINADDYYEPDGIRYAIESVRDRPEANIVHGDIFVAYPNGQRKVRHARHSGFLLKYWEMILNHPSFFVRRSYYARHPFDTRFRITSDHAWTVRAYMEDPRQFLYIPKPLATFTIGGASSTMGLRKAVNERWRVSRALGMGLLASILSVLLRIVLYLPQKMRFHYNQLSARA